MTNASLLAEKDGPIGWMIFHNPDHRNAVTYEMWAAMPGILADFAADPAVRVIVLRGGGGETFVSGADISQFEAKRSTPEAIADYNARLAEATIALSRVQKPTIAMIRGFCIGGGLAIASNCDLRIATDEARFGIPAARLGLGYAYEGIKRLVDLIGPSFTKEIFYTARQFDSKEAAAMGLVNRVVPAAELESYTREYAARIAGNAPLTIKAVKLSAEAAVAEAGGNDLREVRQAIEACNRSADYQEGRRAFIEKRRPQFTGK
ncbi:MAG: enoyl-CoA hydratase [Sulfurifustaceae bacterium]